MHFGLTLKCPPERQVGLSPKCLWHRAAATWKKAQIVSLTKMQPTHRVCDQTGVCYDLHKVSTKSAVWLCDLTSQKWKNKFLWCSCPIAMSSFQWGQWKPGNEDFRMFAQQLKHLNLCPDCKVSYTILPEKISREMAESHQGINWKEWSGYSPGTNQQQGLLDFPAQDKSVSEGHCGGF